MRPAVFLDRDGTVNESVRDASGLRPPRTLEELRVSPETCDWLARLRHAGYMLVVVTNQPDVARGTLAQEVLDALNDRLVELLGVDAVYSCTHDTDDACPCRKPLPGMLLEAAVQHDVDLARSWLVGDRWVDVAAGVAAGVRSLLIRHDESWLATSSGLPDPALRPEAEFGTFGECADYILRQTSASAPKPR